jgi:SAM-dependent methyltransferase
MSYSTNSFGAWLRNVYAETRGAYLQGIGYSVPLAYQATFVNCGGAAEVQYIFERFLQGLPRDAKILIVGVMGGRDYFLCKNLGYQVVGLDVGPQPEIDNLIIHNVEDPLPFPDYSFDAAILSEVLEHLVRDGDALLNVRRVLKPEGRLLISIPFYNDYEISHIRVHSPMSVRRLLAAAGFQVLDYLERPGLVTLRKFNLLQHGASALCYAMSGKTLYAWTTSFSSKFEYWMGHKLWLRPLRSRSKAFGGYYLCRLGPRTDHLTLNRTRFTVSRTRESPMHKGR